MKWPWPLPRLAEVLGITFAIAIICVLAVLGISRQQTPNAGFGPNWDCIQVPNGEPVCVKRINTSK
jgi:hypothetical protein